MFAANVGGIDRIIRIVAGLVLIVAGFFLLGGTLGIILGILGLVFLLTGLIGWCPLYLPLHFSTSSSKKLS
jgi:hypothetical protein